MPTPGATEAEARAEVIEGSIAASMGRALEPVFAPLGFDWRINVGLIGSLAAREVVISTLAQVYAYSGSGDDTRTMGTMLATTDPRTGRPPLTRPAALALLAFFVFALQCTSTLAVMRRETGGWKWPAFAFTYMFIAAWLAGWLTHVIATALGA